MTITDWEAITIASIRANAVSLLGQLNDYDFISLSMREFSALEEIEKELHGLVKEITEQKQCGSCEQMFYNLDEDKNCPHCGSGNWVFGCIDEPEPTLDK